MLGIILLPLLVAGCFVLMAKGFSEDGIPFSNKTNLTGNAGKLLGVLCGLLGSGFFILWIFMVKGSLMSK